MAELKLEPRSLTGALPSLSPHFARLLHILEGHLRQSSRAKVQVAGWRLLLIPLCLVTLLSLVRGSCPQMLEHSLLCS